MTKKTKVLYWVATFPILWIMGAGGIYDMLRPQPVVEIMNRLGYPSYFPVMLGVAKVLGVLALLHPRTVVLREWAYAGFTFNLIAASIAHAVTGDGAFAICFPLALLIPLFASRSLRARRQAPDASNG